MSLNYSQKRLLNMARHRPEGKHATLSHMSRRSSFKARLEIYAFWTGLVSTLVSIVQVFVMGFDK